MNRCRTRGFVMVVAALVGLALVVGCEPFSSRSVQGPYVSYLFLTASQVRSKLGSPDSKETHGTSELWSYESHGLYLHLFEGELLSINQSKGKVTPELAIGDDESRIREIAGEGTPGRGGVRMYTFEQDGLKYTVFTEDGIIVRARIGLPSGP